LAEKQQFRIQNVSPYGIRSYENAVFWSFFANSLWYKELANLNSELLAEKGCIFLFLPLKLGWVYPPQPPPAGGKQD